MAPHTSTTPRRSTTGLCQFLGLEQQRDWVEGKADLRDADERSESLELRFKYIARFQKLLRRPQAQEVLEILGLYGQSCLPMPRKTERDYWPACPFRTSEEFRWPPAIFALTAALITTATAASAATLGIPTRDAPIMSGVGVAFHDPLLGFDLLGDGAASSTAPATATDLLFTVPFAEVASGPSGSFNRELRDFRNRA